MPLNIRLILMNFLEFAVWGAYLTSMGTYLGESGHGDIIGWFYSVQGIASIITPGLMGVIADRWIPAQRLLSLCHLLSGAFMVAAGMHGMQDSYNTGILFILYTCGVAFYMPTLALANAVAFNALQRAELDTVKAFPPIRVFGTVGFICAMWLTDICGFQPTSHQFTLSGVICLLLAAYALTLPPVPIKAVTSERRSLIQALGLDALTLFRRRDMAMFFLFSMLLGVSLQITNGYANPYITSFKDIPQYAHTFGAEHANILISLSQVSETFCILLIPFFMKRFGIRRVMMIAMAAWVLRFSFFALGNPGSGVWLFVLSCLVYGVAFDFFNISGALYVDEYVSKDIRSSAQGLFQIMTAGFGAAIGTLGAQWVVNTFVDFSAPEAEQLIGWRTCWHIFAAYAFVILVLFAIAFRRKTSQK